MQQPRGGTRQPASDKAEGGRSEGESKGENAVTGVECMTMAGREMERDPCLSACNCGQGDVAEFASLAKELMCGSVQYERSILTFVLLRVNLKAL